MVPVGDANIISGICKGSIELKTSNLLKNTKIIGVQSDESLLFLTNLILIVLSLLD